MPDALLLSAAVIADVVGMGWLALAMDAHWRRVIGGAAPRGAQARWMRGLGALALLVSLALCLRVDHVSMAVLVWVMALSAAATCVALTLTWRARWLRLLVPRGWR